ncbi:MAG: hypothetical protein E5X19_04200, partial [Mesorhizobium sp.]
MGWFLIGAALVAWLIYLGRKQSLAKEAPQRSRRPAQERVAPTSQRIASPQQPWQDPRSRPDRRFTDGSDQWERRPVTASMLVGDSGRQPKAPAKWIPSGEGVRVAGVSINSGMFYLGASFAGKSG